MITPTKKRSLIFLFFFFSLLISLFFKENSSGGSEIDFTITRQFVEVFHFGFLKGMQNSIYLGQIHSPLFYMLIAYSENILSPAIIKIGYTTISSLLPIIVYIILKKKYKYADKNYLFAIASIIYFSPYFRSSSSWLTNDNIALIFFSLAISKYCSVENNQNIFKNFFICFFYLSIASYFRQYYAIFSIFFLIESYKKLKFNKFIILINLNLILATPAFIYLYLYLYIQKNNLSDNALKPDLIKNILIFLSIFLFYLTPIIFNKNYLTKIIESFKNEKLIILVLLTVFIIFNFNYNIKELSSNLGGGIIYKICKNINYNIIYYFICFLSSLIIYNFAKFNKINLLIFFCLIFAFPFTIIYQKYFDPLLWIIIFGLIKSDIIYESIKNKNINIKFTYLFFIIFFVLSNVYQILYK
jgi:hypothetical protein